VFDFAIPPGRCSWGVTADIGSRLLPGRPVPGQDLPIVAAVEHLGLGRMSSVFAR